MASVNGSVASSTASSVAPTAGRDARAMLMDFYGIQGVAAAPVASPTGDGASSAGGASSAPAARRGAARGAAREDLDMDSQGFDAERYARRLISTSTLGQLGERERMLVGEVTALDSEMKTLVYENYSKFISATETIRRMRSHVEAMEGEMHQLLGLMEGIERSSADISTGLAGPLGRVHTAWEMEKTLQQRKFLFELPGRLRTAITIKAYGQATKYYVGADPVLTKFSDVRALRDIKAECDGIIGGLVESLRNILEDPSVALDDARSAASQLLELRQPIAGVRRLFVESQLSPLTDELTAARRRLGSDTHTATLLTENALQNDPNAWSKVMDPVYSLWPTLIEVTRTYLVLFLTVSDPVEAQLAAHELSTLRDRFWDLFQSLALLAAQSTVHATDTLQGLNTMYARFSELQAAAPAMFSAATLDAMSNRVIDRQFEYSVEDARARILAYLQSVQSLSLGPNPESAAFSALAGPLTDVVAQFVENMRAFLHSEIPALRSTEEVLYNRVCVKVQHLLLVVPERAYQLLHSETDLDQAGADGVMALASLARELQLSGVPYIASLVRTAAPRRDLEELAEMHAADIGSRLSEVVSQLLRVYVDKKSRKHLDELAEYLGSDQWSTRATSARYVSKHVLVLVDRFDREHIRISRLMAGCVAGIDAAPPVAPPADVTPLARLADAVMFHPRSVAAAMAVRLLKAYVEYTRAQTLTAFSANQVQIDYAALRRCLVPVVDASQLEYYTKEMFDSLRDRTNGEYAPLADSLIDSILNIDK
jgi:hypothetical protein